MAELFLIGGATDVMLERLEAAFAVHKASEMDDPQAWLAENGGRITHVATNGHDGVTPEYMAAMPNLKAISCYGVGYDAIDVQAAKAKGVVVTHTPNVLNAEVATTAVLLMLACYRELLRDDAYVRSGRWEAEGNSALTRSADNQTVGILGLGRIGQAIADKLAPWGTTIVYHSRSAKDVPYKYYGDLTEMAKDVDTLICITPGGPSTNKIVNAEVMNALGPQGTLINVSRGSVVDEAAMIAALQEGRLGWAGLDVFEAEPHVPEALRKLDNVVLLPHVGSATHETRAAMGALTVDNLLQHLKDGTVISAVPECADM
ncbi:2-hydroxyacid dehydrogenase [Roseobacter sinensis]|uniref:2-hydroxyacid dehydrogenase n=1 Tax=Roseobacter sinensis TaxID=2931391 RepID=A0ABT3B9N6_9RHOB|nr:2-hydroxyacid dehydrogenase [Roseobacter sp. WL0113]MCV3270292.1 2-hydroxyacid dehydrogenase [Roseobacter sp. WL0113]